MPELKEKKFNFIYKTTCQITGRYYIGMHSTDNLDDGYLGSGKRLRHSIRKHGAKNHTIERLEFFDTRKQLAKREEEIVNENEIAKEKCMNLITGGESFLPCEFHRKVALKGLNSFRKKIKTDIKFRETFVKKVSDAVKRQHKEGKGVLPNWLGRHHSIETKKKIGISVSKSQSGIKNSQYGTRWITNGIEAKKINKNSQVPEGWRLGRK